MNTEPAICEARIARRSEHIGSSEANIGFFFFFSFSSHESSPSAYKQSPDMIDRSWVSP